MEREREGEGEGVERERERGEIRVSDLREESLTEELTGVTRRTRADAIAIAIVKDRIRSLVVCWFVTKIGRGTS